MRTVNIHEAKTHLSRLVDEVYSGEEIIIAKAGKPLAKLVALTAAAWGNGDRSNIAYLNRSASSCFLRSRFEVQVPTRHI